jgi:deoxyadenosine/deoxycytidine kinase
MCFRALLSALWTATWMLATAFAVLVLASADAIGLGQSLLGAYGRLVGQCLYTGVTALVVVSLLAYHKRAAHGEHAAYWRRRLWLFWTLSTLGVCAAAFRGDERQQRVNRFAASVMVRMMLIALMDWLVGASIRARRQSADNALDHQQQQQSAKTTGNKTTEHIFLEGNICAGKTSLCKRMTKHTDWLHVAEPLHTALFNMFNEKHGSGDSVQLSAVSFAFQMVMHERRKRAVATAALMDGNREWSVLDRSLVGDYAFALCNFLNGSMDQYQYELYHDQQERDVVALVKPELDDFVARASRPKLVFLVQSAAQCLARLRKRAGSDTDMPLDYLVGVSIAHYMCMVRLIKYATRKDKPLPLDIFVTDQPPWLDSTKRECDKFCSRLRRNRRLPCAQQLNEPGTMELRNGSEHKKRYESVCAQMHLPVVLRDDANDGISRVDEQAWHSELMLALKKYHAKHGGDQDDDKTTKAK